MTLEGVRFSWEGDAGFTLNVPDWSVAAGSRACVVGPSGSGKSTLLSLLSGERVAEAGAVVVGGDDLSGMSEAARRRWRLKTVGFVFQDFPLVPYLDALENALLPYRLGLSPDAGARARARGLLTTLGLADKAGAAPGALSQGERQRVAVARALVTRPAVLLADEPTAGLDPARSDAVVDLLSRSCEERGTTLVLVTHDPRLQAGFGNTLELG